ncbi:unnamed protein product [Rotaria socialis]|uniref:Spermatogenesis-associated protein 1 C-terminal domain-containing protein n=1 Tax=Rotaria socialis TaxID=392032 RepID=A0A818YZS3_9BILA|nr:unnamed protein product [Rotaria socialis]
MQSPDENQPAIFHKNLITVDRPDSSQFVDLHVYIIPKKVWKGRQNLAENEVITQAVSAGFVHVPENSTIDELRQYITHVCGEDASFPKDFMYLRSVGRCLTKVKHNQENELQVKHYRPPMIYIIGVHHNDDSSRVEYEPNPSSMSEQFTNSQFWTNSLNELPTPYPLLNHNHHKQESPTINFTFSKNLTKLREEQKRLYLQQQALARKRHELEDRDRKEKAAARIQAAYRAYCMHRRNNTKKQEEVIPTIEYECFEPEEQKITIEYECFEPEEPKPTIEYECFEPEEQKRAIEYERFEPEERKPTIEYECFEPERSKPTNEIYTEENKTHEDVPTRLKVLKSKRTQLESDRTVLVHRLQQLNAEISRRRREEKDLWKKKYIIEKNTILSVTHTSDIQRERATIRLNDATKLRQQAEYESRLLRQELQKISSNLNKLGRYRLPKEPFESEETEPISLSITWHY